jgi:Na+/H+-dicarboxylate symporter
MLAPVSFTRQLVVAAGAFAGAAAVAGVAGAANLGTALAFGQIGFALAVVALLVRA